ncbi:hypothetical protein ACQPYA_06855 [Micromonospora sp. CA-263727]|uniref:hypothetical protein n=1 Tax=Micromonospora sp. CA-263727 TaxID=3239967 RepID=UPI003D90A882
MATGRPVRDEAPPVRFEEIHGALLLHTGSKQAAALRAVTTALARAHPETVVVTSPAVTGRADVYRLVAEALDRTAAARPAVRLVLLGEGPDRAARISGIREVATRLGRPVTGPLGRVTVAADGTCVSRTEPAAPDDSPLGWHTRSAAGDGHDEAPWSPTPAWPETPAPQRWHGPGLVARPVPAGLWLLPPGTPAECSGTVESLPREADAATLFVGGCGRPVAVDDLVAAVAALRPDPATRLVLLPGALPAGTGLAALADLPVRLRCAVPARTGAGRRLVPVTPDGVVLPIDAVTAPPERAGVTAPDPGDTPAPTGVPPVPEPSAAPRAAQARGKVAGRSTAAGWSFLPDGSPPLGFVAAIATTVIEVAAGRRGFTVDGTTIGAVGLASLLLEAGIPARMPLVVVDPDTAVRAALLADLATAWGATVYAPSGPAALTVAGALLAAGGFTAHPPGAAARPVGPVLPTACASTLAALAARMTPRPPDGRRRVGRRINGHHRPAEEVTAGEPGDRDDGSSGGTDPALIALRAWAGGGPAGAATALALARMPLVFGPVFATIDRPEIGYAPGVEIVEPGFVRARLSPGPPTTDGLTCVIWSASGRHLDATFSADGPACVFAPGSRFRVLGVDAGDPTVVYLADLATDRPFDVEDLLSRLRASRGDRTAPPPAA